MQQIQHLSLAWMHLQRQQAAGEAPSGPLPLPDRERIRRVAQIYHSQLRQTERSGGNADEIARQQIEELRRFTLELEPDAALQFMNIFTEETSAFEREWLARKHDWEPNRELPPMFVTVLMFAVTILAIALAIRFAV